MKAPFHGGTSRRAAVLIIFAAGLFTFFSFVALVVDVGYLYAIKSRAQAVVDTIALSVVTTINPTQSAANQTNFLKALTQRLLLLNGLQAEGYRLVLEGLEPVAPASASIDSAPRHAFTGTISGQEAVGAFFSRVLGKSRFVVGVSSRAELLVGPGKTTQAILLD